MHFRHISAKIQLKILKQYFDWVGPGPPRPALATPLKTYEKKQAKKQMR